MTGPYETERDAAAEPLAREIRALHKAGRVRSGDPDRIVSGTQLTHLEAACTAAGVDLGAYDRRILGWLASWDETTAQVIIGLISRASAQTGADHTAAAIQAVRRAVGREPDFGGWLANVLRTAAELEAADDPLCDAASDKLIAGRPGSWEAEVVLQLAEGGTSLLAEPLPHDRSGT